jgi:hypothetical protein
MTRGAVTSELYDIIENSDSPAQFTIPEWNSGTGQLWLTALDGSTWRLEIRREVRI